MNRSHFLRTTALAATSAFFSGQSNALPIFDDGIIDGSLLPPPPPLIEIIPGVGGFSSASEVIAHTSVNNPVQEELAGKTETSAWQGRVGGKKVREAPVKKQEDHYYTHSVSQRTTRPVSKELQLELKQAQASIIGNTR